MTDPRCFHCNRPKSEHEGWSLAPGVLICPTALFITYEDEAVRQEHETQEVLNALRPTPTPTEKDQP